jgi:acyl-CoA thioesterase-1
LDGQNLRLGSAAGSIVFNGTLLLDFPAIGEPSPEPEPEEPPPAEGGVTVITVRASAAAGSDLSKLRLLIDGQEVAATVVSQPDFAELHFEIDGIEAGRGHRIGIQHYHDTAARALTVDWVEVNGVRLDGASGVQDVAALDGVNLIHGPAAETIMFNGTLLLDAPASAFPAGPGSGPPTPEAPGAVAHWGFPTQGGAGRPAIGQLDAELRGGAAGIGGALRLDGADDHIVMFTPGGDGRIDLMVLGDSLSALSTKHIAPADSYPTQLGLALTAAGHGDVDIIAFSKGGDTTAMGLARLQTYLADPTKELPDAVILELGTNDSLRTLPIADVEANLRAILDLFEARGVEVLLAGTQGSWPLLGKGYWSAAGVAKFEQLFPDLAAEYDAVLYRNFLDGVLADPATLTTDNLHPNAVGTKLVVDNMLPAIETLLDGAEDATLADPTELAQGSVSFWLRADDVDGVQGLLSKDSAGSNAGDVSLWLDGSRLVLRVEDAAGSHRVETAAGSIAASDAVQVGFTFDGGTARLYLNGDLVGSTAFAGDWRNDPDPLVLGALADQSSSGAADNLRAFLDGGIDEVSLFDRVLSATEMERIHRAGEHDLL